MFHILSQVKNCVNG